jgi:plastocyanin
VRDKGPVIERARAITRAARKSLSPTLRNQVLGTVVGLLLAAVGTACGDTGADAPPAGSTKVTMIDYRFTPSTLNAKPGMVTFLLVNTGTQPHDMVVSNASGTVVGRSQIVQPGNSAVLTLNSLTPGSYDVSCDIPGHKDSGMVSKLTVA